jgi:hypothetical protein
LLETADCTLPVFSPVMHAMQFPSDKWAVGGATRKGASAGKASKTTAQLKKNKAPARRQINRWKDDVVVCPLCLGHPWGRGRISNCRDHICRRSCAEILTKIHVVTSADGAEVPRTGFWIHPDGKATVAALTPGTGRRSRRVYWTPETFCTVAEAEGRWSSSLLMAELQGAKAAKIVLGEEAADSMLQHPIWSAGFHSEHTNDDGSVDIGNVTCDIPLDDWISNPFDDDFEVPASPEIPASPAAFSLELEVPALDDPVEMDPAEFTDFDPWNLTPLPLPFGCDGGGVFGGVPMR